MGADSQIQRKGLTPARTSRIPAANLSLSIGRAHVASLHLFPTTISKWLFRSFDACLSPTSWVCPASRQYNCATLFCCVTNHFTAIKIKRAPLVQRNPTLAVLLFRSLAFSVRIDNLSRACALLGGHFSVSYSMGTLLTTSS